jgi:hypothetical protein
LRIPVGFSEQCGQLPPGCVLDLVGALEGDAKPLGYLSPGHPPQKPHGQYLPVPRLKLGKSNAKLAQVVSTFGPVLWAWLAAGNVVEFAAGRHGVPLLVLNVGPNVTQDNTTSKRRKLRSCRIVVTCGLEQRKPCNAKQFVTASGGSKGCVGEARDNAIVDYKAN